ncbi:UvrD-helicase domain-containing protein [Candidatus Bipolaricaulota bacterium]|nr:UvrD-helicase domain-containing protein [Candidatus Bipolaricaulota bacterium]
MNKEPNERQSDVINNTDGIYLVHAGPGTGKTFTLTKRYVHLIDDNEDIEPSDILFVTFTRNAANEMRERIINRSESYNHSELREAPIRTFHAHAKTILGSEGFDAPEILGIDDFIPPSTEIVERAVNEKERFSDFYKGFTAANPEYEDFYSIINDPTSLLDVVKNLAVKGLAPKAEGWFGKKGLLDGDFDKFLEGFEQYNRPLEGVNRLKNSKIRGKLTSFQDNYLFQSPPDEEELGVTGDDKKVNKGPVREAFYEDRGKLKRFIHDLYYGYLKFCLSNDYLNFNFLLLFAFVLLKNREEVRSRLNFDYIMVDEFQDTNELQFKTTMLLSGTGNICAVGDWKQSIYGFRYADVDNIREFQERLVDYRDELNFERERIPYRVSGLETKKLKKNYRSTDKIIDISEHSMYLKGSKKEEIDEERIRAELVHLKGVNQHPTSVNLLRSEDEVEAVLTKIQQIVEGQELMVERDEESKNGGYRPVQYGDIAVLSRRNDFALKIQNKAEEYNIPAVFEGGIALFQKKAALLLLAWLRVLENENSSRGWAVILEQAGYLMDEVEHITSEGDYPDNLAKFRETLESYPDVVTVARAVFDKYDLRGDHTSKILSVLSELTASSFFDLTDIIHFMENQIESKEKYEIDSTSDMGQHGEHITIKTIHKAKGLEFPVVFLVDVSESHFPQRDSGSESIFYDETLGLRQTKTLAGEESYPYDHWQGKLLQKCQPSDYSEERRLAYVAMTRAKQHLFVSAQEGKESRFFKDLRKRADSGGSVENVKPDLEKVTLPEEQLTEFSLESTPVEPRYSFNASELIGEASVSPGGIGADKGDKVHRFAQEYCSGKNGKELIDINDGALSRHVSNVKNFLDGIESETKTEIPCYLPLNTKKTGPDITVKGKIDLLLITPDRVEIIDYKTSNYDELLEEEYKKQLSVYYHAVKDSYVNEKDNFLVKIFYTGENRLNTLEPYSKEKVTEMCLDNLQFE